MMGLRRTLSLYGQYRIAGSASGPLRSSRPVKLAAATVNLALTDGAGRSVTVPANDRVEVQFPAAAEMAGTARFQIRETSSATGKAYGTSRPARVCGFASRWCTRTAAIMSRSSIVE